MDIGSVNLPVTVSVPPVPASPGMIVPPSVIRFPWIVPIPCSVPPLRSNEWPAARVIAPPPTRVVVPADWTSSFVPPTVNVLPAPDGDQAGIGEAGVDAVVRFGAPAWIVKLPVFVARKPAQDVDCRCHRRSLPEAPSSRMVAALVEMTSPRRLAGLGHLDRVPEYAL